MPTTILKFLLPVLMNEAGADGGEGGGGGDAGGGDAGADGGQQGGAAGSAGGSALATGGQAPVPIHEQMPEKFRVFEGEGEEKAFNLEASTAKMLQSYGELSKRLGSDEAPPENAEGYQLDGEALGVEDVEAFMKDETNQSFLKKCHANGMTNKQVQMVVEHALKEFAPNLTAGNELLNTEGCIKELQANVWPDEQEYKTNMASANRAFMSLPQELQQLADTELGNNPTFNRIMAVFGKEMAEDTPPNNETSAEEQANVETMMQSEAYRDPKHPEHNIVSKKVQAFFTKKYNKAS